MFNQTLINPSANNADPTKLIRDFVKAVVKNLDTKLIGIYLFGSLTYQDFKPNRSDIDFMVITKDLLDTQQVEKIEEIHFQLEQKHPHWRHRVEASYSPASFLENTLPPKQPRPYYGEGKMWPRAPYGNEWLINLALIHQYGQTLWGSKFQNLVQNIESLEIRKAVIRDLIEEWEPKLGDDTWIANDHYQSYLILNLCRILVSASSGNLKSKSDSAYLVKRKFSRWQKLIETAEHWGYGSPMCEKEQTIKFLEFVIDQIKKQPLYSELTPPHH